MHDSFMQQAISLAEDNVKNGGGPFGAVISKDNKLLATGVNLVTRNNDPSAHAEIIAIRNACKKLNNFKLSNCIIYSNCEPCPMCLAALYWADISHIYYAATRHDAEAIDFSDNLIYNELSLPPRERTILTTRMQPENTLAPFKQWLQLEDKICY
jgi:guanine deaminase